MRTILSINFDNIGQLQRDGTYYVYRLQRKIRLSKSSILNKEYPRWIVFDRII